MNRTVIDLSQGTGGTVRASLQRAPIHFEYASVELDLSGISGSGAGTALQERGQALGKLLSSAEPLKSVLSTAVKQPATADAAPLYFHVHTTDADAVLWEQLYLPPVGFCALDRRSPVGRIADRQATVRSRYFRPPLKVVAVLSAAQRNPLPQLASLRKAVAASPIPATLHVISGDEDVVGALDGPGETGELIAGNAPDLCRQLQAAGPHILHLLCHGQKLAAVPVLTFAHLGDVDAGEALGSVNVTVENLVSALGHCDPWLVVLAACQTADAEDLQGRSFAHELVYQGMTAAIGMRRLVDLTNTNQFCGTLYPVVLAAVAEAVSTPGTGEHVIDWAQVLIEPRLVLGGSNPLAVDTWLDPVLYAQYDDLRVLPHATVPAPTEAPPSGPRGQHPLEQDGGPVPPPADGSATAHARLQGRLDQFRAVLYRDDLAPELRDLLEDEIAQLQSALQGSPSDVPGPGR